MKRKKYWLATTCLIVLAFATYSAAQAPQQMRFKGTINDFSPGNVTPPGPWQVSGDWSMVVRGDSGTADFAASVAMVRSDAWVTAHGDVNDPSGRTPHTHHIRLTNGTVTMLPNGFKVTGDATITASGMPAPFGLVSPIEIDIIGGNVVAFSNIKVTLGSPAAVHFGSQPLEGVVNQLK